MGHEEEGPHIYTAFLSVARHRNQRIDLSLIRTFPQDVPEQANVFEVLRSAGLKGQIMFADGVTGRRPWQL